MSSPTKLEQLKQPSLQIQGRVEDKRRWLVAPFALVLKVSLVTAGGKGPGVRVRDDLHDWNDCHGY